jgi:hypothetical protein
MILDLADVEFGMAIEDIAHLVGHANTRVTEMVYRKELRPALTRGAGAMDEMFPRVERKSQVSSLVSRSPLPLPLKL